MIWPWHKCPPPVRPRVAGVWATAHTRNGDYDLRSIVGVEINGEWTTYELRNPSVPITGTVETFTLHLGTVMVEVALRPPEHVWAGGSLTGYFPTAMNCMKAHDPVRRDYR